MKFLHMAKLAVFWDLAMHCKLFYDENYPCNASFYADSRVLKPCIAQKTERNCWSLEIRYCRIQLCLCVGVFNFHPILKFRKAF